MARLRSFALLAGLASCEAVIDTIAYPMCEENYDVCLTACEEEGPDRYEACADGCDAQYECCIADD